MIITGEEQSFDWTQNRPTGLDLAAEGIVVVSIQSRMNVFGWLSLRNADAPGNLGLLDQRLAFEWIEENIHKFGGDKRKMTLLGHGTSGATNAMLHLTNPKTAAMLMRLILMSGSIYSTYSFQANNNSRTLDQMTDPSMAIVKKLACDSAQNKYTLDCLRQKSVTDLLKAFEHVYQVRKLNRIRISSETHFRISCLDISTATIRVYLDLRSIHICPSRCSICPLTRKWRLKTAMPQMYR